MMVVIGLFILLLLSFFIWLDFHLGRKNVQRHEIKTPSSCSGNALLLTTGTQFFDTLFEDIEKARHHLHIQFYIYHEDCIGKEMSSLLKKKAKEGVQVRLLVDYMGSFFLKKKAIKELKKAGVQFAYSFSPEFPYFFYKLNRRNHRKVTIIDGHTGFMGGFNVGDEYLGRDPKLGYWRDYHMQLSGPVIHTFQQQFLMDWEAACGEKISGSENEYFPEQQEGPIKITTLFSARDIYSFCLQQINQAKTSITIGSPYFIPDRTLQNALLHAIKRGVEVTLLVPMKSDHLLVKEASYFYFKDLLKAGCRVEEYYEGFFHAKVFLVDDKICDIGTANFDQRSFFTNSEVNCIFEDEHLIQEAQKAIKEDLDRSETLTLTVWERMSYWKKTKILVAKVFSPFL
ncbi:cardiolipin synthase [Fictibacillus fluitans]|uniref:Cardiolipin synthase n=1 Tax=Fictibacillus fluitans TaxID=3058422 RepID=A0ABT8HVG8_9BACL|nr:cardiolipin synthase [Fictibacillus sp. NE201]MDN4524751.1 cardiolipin synthase [Fictibacillus sp. NE201]